MGFKKLKLSEKMFLSLNEMGFSEPTEIQESVINIALEGRDIIGQAQTGTGKTAAFAIPIIEKTDVESKKIQHLILAPTRELAAQIFDQFERIGKKHFGIKVGLILGGVSYDRQRQTIKDKPHILIATPGRLNDLMDSENNKNIKIDFSELKSLTLDEADELLKIGFYEEIKRIIKALPKYRQNFFFTATFDKKTKELSELITTDPVVISVSQGLTTNSTIKQEYAVMREGVKLSNLTKFLDLNKPGSVVIFGRTKRRVDELSDALRELGFKASGIQGDMQQRERSFVMDKFRKQEISILVATDVMARGIDVDHVEWVINFDLPQEIEYYTHRIGRTGRAGREGYSLSFVKPEEISHMERIANETSSVIEEIEIPSDKELKDAWEERLFSNFDKILEKHKNAKYTSIKDDLVQRFNTEELAIILADYIANSKNSKKDIKLSPEPGVVIKNKSSKQGFSKSKKDKKRFMDKKIDKIDSHKKHKNNKFRNKY
ncbi:DEAD/DEAH box helicase [Mycoplasma procyoni]|uniref:DEAD/DEAH box helicase n=1 Tax=Mycoplasma procyoni TaxID=568784 RepID=UPI00197B3AD9|nr:DEAD/DEAH box helicase [Mycoplasma procyoni]MBN3534629.1 DEAD/DEAH box helicase [Mycoplasma procyoni]